MKIKTQEKILFAYRDFTHQGKSHRGCGVGAEMAVKVLNREGIPAVGLPLWSKEDLARYLRKDPAITVCIVEAIFLTIPELGSLCAEFPNVLFIPRVHAAPASLVQEPEAIKLIRAQIEFGKNIPNLELAGNCFKFSETASIIYNTECLYLPNLYDTELQTSVIPHQCADVLRVSSFGASRPLKLHSQNLMVAMTAAKMLGKSLEFLINVGRNEGGGNVLGVIREFSKDLDWVKVIEVPWQDWAEFYKTVGTVQVGLQLSVTESFDFVVADHMVQRIPILCSPMVPVAPDYFKESQVDDPIAGAKKLIELLQNPKAGDIGYKALKKEVAASLKVWKSFLGIKTSWWD